MFGGGKAAPASPPPTEQQSKPTIFEEKAKVEETVAGIVSEFCNAYGCNLKIEMDVIVQDTPVNPGDPQLGYNRKVIVVRAISSVTAPGYEE